MKHSIREHIIDPVRGKIVKVSTINAELGSGITDKNGREIFEGDIVAVGYNKAHFRVEFYNGKFSTEVCNIDRVQAEDLEVVGHVGD